MSAEPQAEQASDEGAWEYREGDGPWSGWLFRYADGTLVAQDGTVLEEPAEPVAPAEPAEAPSSSRGAGDWVFHDGTDDLEGWIYHHPDGRLEREDGSLVDDTLEPQPAPEPAPLPVPIEEPEPVEEPAGEPVPAARADRDGDWVFHDGTDDLEGWIYHHPDGTLEREDGTPLETTLEPQPAPEPAPLPVPVEEPEPAEQPAREPVPAARADRDGDWVFHDGTDDLHGWIYHHPDGTLEREDGTPVETPPPAAADAPPAAAEVESEPATAVVEPVETTGDHEPAASEPEPQPEPEPEPEPQPAATPQPAPAYLRWEASVVPQYVAGAVFVAAAIGAVVLLVDYLGDTATGRLVPAVGLALLAGAALLALGSLSPTVVVLRDGAVEVAHGETKRRYDLADDAVRVDLPGETSSLSWRARLAHPDGDVDLLTRRQVDPREFTDAVRAYRPEA